jgi:hypothetical protein
MKKLAFLALILAFFTGTAHLAGMEARAHVGMMAGHDAQDTTHCPMGYVCPLQLSVQDFESIDTSAALVSGLTMIALLAALPILARVIQSPYPPPGRVLPNTSLSVLRTVIKRE